MPSFDRPRDASIPPSPWVRRWAHLVRAGGTLLDLACGDGRHARFFRALGHPVLAADIDVSGIADLAGDPGLEILAADLEAGPWPLPGRRFAGIVVTNYLHRPHLALLPTLLEEGGVLVFETFGKGNERYGRPRNPDFLLAPGELLHALGQSLQVVAYEHGREDQPRPAVRQRLCAVKGKEPMPLPGSA